jgi:hypothetical protein
MTKGRIRAILNERGLPKGGGRTIKRLLVFFASAAVIFIVAVGIAYPQDRKVLFREDFHSLENWQPLNFQNKPEHTAYTIETNGNEPCLKASSNASASAIVHNREFNVYDYPIVQWRWKVSNIYQNADPEKKSGDDYPIRIYVAFKYDPQTATTAQKMKFGFIKRVYGEYPPQYTLMFVWANRPDQKAIMTSPYTDSVKIVALEKGEKNVGPWQDHQINIVEDFRKAFGGDPPAVAQLAIMNDSDNTRQKSVSYVGFIEVSKNGQ